MKKNQLLALAIAFGLLLSSCGSLSVSRMRYTKGLNIGLFSSKETKPYELKAKKAEKKSTNPAQPVSNENTDIALKTENTNATPSSISSSDVVASESASTNNIENKTSLNSKSKVSKKEVKSIVKNIKASLNASKINSSEVNKSESAAGTNESDVNIIILVILCLIPPLGLLAVYLHDGEIGTPFWITLLLYLLFILPGVIYSLLVVLDVI